ncbi:MAG TPA: SDR family oxidoreductase [Acidimicrobiales bacterium]|nr:SDR family oxidoreductase [Acidimicrobiales bacterium]
MGALDGRVAIITGAGRGLGREHALLFAKEGARVVVNDLGGGPDGSGSDKTAAEQVVEEIEALGGQAIANADSVADWDGAKRLIDATVEAFGDLHVLVNNAGILRDRKMANMSEEEWDAVINVHLKGTFAPTHFAAQYWRAQVEAGKQVNAAVVNTSSTAGLHANVGQANYGSAKMGIAAFTQICAKELKKLGVRSNAIAPAARTRLTEATPGFEEIMKAPEDPNTFDPWDPANISPLVAYLATAECPFTGQVFSVFGDEIGQYQSWTIANMLKNDGRRWTVEELAAAAKELPLKIDVRRPL